MNLADLSTALRSAETVFRHIGDDALAGSMYAARSTCTARIQNGESEVHDAITNKLWYELDLASKQTADLLLLARTAGLLEDIQSVWADVVDRWTHSHDKIMALWTPVAATAREFVRTYSMLADIEEAAPEFISVYVKPAAPEWTQAIQQLSAEEPALRLMFFQAENPNVLWVGDIHDETAVDALLSVYPKQLWRGTAQLSNGAQIHEFSVYTIDGRCILRLPGYLATPHRGLLEAVKRGENLPRMAKLKTATNIRVTFSVRAMQDASFKNLLRGLGGMPISPTTWEIPIVREGDVDAVLDRIRSGYDYSVSVYSLVDHPSYAYTVTTGPEAVVARMLSAEVEDVITDRTVTMPSYLDLVSHLEEILQWADNDVTRFALERVTAAARVCAHYVVAMAGEIAPKANHIQHDITKLFRGARTEGDHIRVAVVVGDGITYLVNTDMMDAIGTDPFRKEEA